MKVTTISNFRKDTKKYFDHVIDDQEILLITRTDGQTIVALPLEEYNALTQKAPKQSDARLKGT